MKSCSLFFILFVHFSEFQGGKKNKQASTQPSFPEGLCSILQAVFNTFSKFCTMSPSQFHVGWQHKAPLSPLSQQAGLAFPPPHLPLQLFSLTSTTPQMHGPRCYAENRGPIRQQVMESTCRSEPAYQTFLENDVRPHPTQKGHCYLESTGRNVK